MLENGLGKFVEMILIELMIIYNVTVNIEDSEELNWLQFMQSQHIPDVMNTKCFVSFSMQRILTRQPGETGNTYAIQYKCESMSDYNRYQEKFAAELQKDHSKKFAGKFVAFRTLLEEVA